MTHDDTARALSASILRLRVHAPFFAALCLFARFVPRDDVPTACTDGRDVFYNPAFLRPLTAAQLDAVVLHEVLHAAMLHPGRRGAREPFRWNYAADVVVNGVVARQPFAQLLPGSVREPALEDKRVEEIYELLPAPDPDGLCPRCLRADPGELPGDVARRLAETEAHWKAALRQAEAAARMAGQGDLPEAARRLLEDVAAPQIDWRAALWRFLVRTPTDYADFDRRFLSRGLYLESLTGETVRVFVAVDTSGSISPAQLGLFVAEMRGILGSYPHLEAVLYYADAAVYGPHDLREETERPAPRGGGGTSFVPFFDRVARDHDPGRGGVCVYLTDGFGSFPAHRPELPVLWVVTPGGAADGAFPFGDVARLLSARG